MPKMKTISGAKKRFRVTSGGKIQRSKAYHNHNLNHKSASRGRRLRRIELVHASQKRQIKRMLVEG